MRRIFFQLWLATAAVGLVADEKAFDTIAGLWTEAKSLRPKLIHFGPPFDLPPELSMRVATLRCTLEAYTQSHSGNDLDTPWRGAVTECFVLSCITEWSTYETARQGLLQWWALLDAAQPAPTLCVPDFAMMLAVYHLQNWVVSEPEKCCEIIDETDRRFGARLSANEKNAWKWWLDRFDGQFQEVARRLPPERRTTLLNRAIARIKASIADDSLPLANRTHTLTNYARTLYSQGNIAQAAALLDDYWKRHGEKITTPDFYSLRFFVTYLGQGDRALAREMLLRATVLVEKGYFDAKEGNFEAMVAAYYSKAPFTEIELKRRAHIYVLERRAKSQNSDGL